MQRLKVQVIYYLDTSSSAATLFIRIPRALINDKLSAGVRGPMLGQGRIEVPLNGFVEYSLVLATETREGS